MNKADLVADLRRRMGEYDRVIFAKSVGMQPDPWQADLLRSDSDRVLLNCSRQSGKSTVAAVIALHRALYQDGALVLILAPSERQAKELFSKIAEFYGQLPESQPVSSDSYRKMGMSLTNGSRIEALPGTEKTVRGFSGVDLLILDEAARVDDELYHAVRPMLAVSGGGLMMLSTPYGKRGAFYEEWTFGGDVWDRYRVTAEECPRISSTFLERERHAVPLRVYRQEYFCSFEDTMAQIFSEEVIRELSDMTIEETEI